MLKSSSKKQDIPTPAQLPHTGKSRYSNFKNYCPFSREKFRQLAKLGKAPQPERMGVRCTFYDNAELHRFLADPLSYEAPKHNARKGMQ